MVNRPEPDRRSRRKAETLPDDGAIQLEMLDYIHSDEDEQQIKNILLDANFWKDLGLEVRDGSPE